MDTKLTVELGRLRLGERLLVAELYRGPCDRQQIEDTFRLQREVGRPCPLVTGAPETWPVEEGERRPRMMAYLSLDGEDYARGKLLFSENGEEAEQEQAVEIRSLTEGAEPLPGLEPGSVLRIPREHRYVPFPEHAPEVSLPLMDLLLDGELMARGVWGGVNFNDGKPATEGMFAIYELDGQTYHLPWGGEDETE